MANVADIAFKSAKTSIGDRGAFGGQILSQAARAAGETVDPALLLHSLHAYFLSFGDVEIPVLYIVERVREGRSYATRSVRAIQRGKAIFILSASFQRPEPDQPSFQIDVSAPTAAGDIFANIPPPEVSSSYLRSAHY